jgi:hypothetical protein
MNSILLVAAIVAFTGAVLGLVLVRSSDFATYGTVDAGMPLPESVSSPSA